MEAPMYNVVITLLADTTDIQEDNCFGVMVCDKGNKAYAPPIILKSYDVDDLEEQVLEAVREFFDDLRANR
jgi:hypothetical protein